VSIIYKTSDRIPVQIGEVVIKLSPLTYDQKTEIQLLISAGGIDSLLKAANTAIKYAVKGISGIQNSDGSDYELKFEGNMLDQESVDDLSNLEECEKLSGICVSILNGIPKEFIDPSTNKPMKDVKIIKSSKGNSKRKK